MRKATKNGQREKNIHEKGNTKWSKGRKLQKILEIIYKVVQEVDQSGQASLSLQREKSIQATKRQQKMFKRQEVANKSGNDLQSWPGSRLNWPGRPFMTEIEKSGKCFRKFAMKQIRDPGQFLIRNRERKHVHL